jgi:hypothetical protein
MTDMTDCGVMGTCVICREFAANEAAAHRFCEAYDRSVGLMCRECGNIMTDVEDLMGYYDQHLQ